MKLWRHFAIYLNLRAALHPMSSSCGTITNFCSPGKFILLQSPAGSHAPRNFMKPCFLPLREKAHVFLQSFEPSQQSISWAEFNFCGCSASLKGSNISNGDLLVLRKAGQGQASQGNTGRPDPQQILQSLRQNQHVLNRLPSSLRDRVVQNDPSVLEEIAK